MYDKDVFDLLHPKLREVIRRLGYQKPTLVQTKAIPIILRGYHTLIIAPTGSGKTEAVIFPCVSKILSKNMVKFKGVKLIYITPLRALNRDLELRLRSILNELGLSINVRHGDTSQYTRKLISKKPPDILVTTPETFQYILINRDLRKYLKSVNFVIVDEFHELMESKRGAELITSLERLAFINPHFQRIALSASIGDERLASNFLAYERRVEVVNVGFTRDTQIKVLIPLCHEDDINCKVRYVANTLKDVKTSLIFTNTRSEAEYLGLKLKELGISVAVHHGSLDKSERLNVESSLREALVKGVVCTSSLELGIDVGNVDLVIQVSSPRQAIKLLQRVGRSLHKIDLPAKGVIVTNINFDDVIESLVIATRALRGNLEKSEPYENPLDVLAHQVIGLALEYSGIELNKIFNIIRKSYPFRNISLETLHDLIKELENLKLIKVAKDKDDLIIEPTVKGRIYYLTTTMIVEASQFDVIDITSNKKVGFLDEKFIALECEVNKVISLGGNLWKIIKVDDGKKKVFVEPIINAQEVIIPSWEGELIPVDGKVSREVCALRRLISIHGCEVLNKYSLSSEYIKKICKDFYNYFKEYEVIPTDRDLVIELIRKKDSNALVINSCLGNKGNATLAYILGYLLENNLRISTVFKYDPYRVIFILNKAITEYDIHEVLNYLVGIDEEEVLNLLKTALRKSKLFEYRLISVLRRVGVITEETPINVVKTLVHEYKGSLFGAEALNEIFTEDLDINILIKFLKLLKEGKVRVHIQNFKEVPKFTYQAINRLGFMDKVKVSVIPDEIIAEIIKRRILRRKMQFICLTCGWFTIREVKDVDNNFKCFKCGSRYIGITKVLDPQIPKLVKNILKKGKIPKTLSEDEKRIIKELIESGNIYLTYGSISAKVLAATGVGPETAKKILSKSFRSDKEFYLMIYEYERKFLLTSKYWD